MVYTRDFLDAFWEKVDVRGPNDCWPWTAATYHDGYGCLGIRGPRGKRTTMRAHVMSLILATGEDADGRFGLHECDNPPCCNPRHLFWGDQQRNIGDMDQRGRRVSRPRRGVANPNARLAETDVRAIRAQYAAGSSQQAIADSFGVSQHRVSEIVRRKAWSHI